MERFPAELTGHLIASYRARFAAISLDPYAHLWVNKDVSALHEEILQRVSPVEDLAHALRNRFFLQRVQRFFRAHPGGVLINLAAGLRHHPLLLEPTVTCIEVERRDTIELKRAAFAAWHREGAIPIRQINYMESDLDDPPSVATLGRTLEQRVDERPVYLLMEGLLAPPTRSTAAGR